ncbi:hypothetical protein ACES2I_11000 [Bdellovibrio bacteriovorus]|uniref:hypothetical protein n=1 Tax=Bdellovibrio bacteriovorus TaxID=959 RepID=UPI0035A5B3BD
MKKHFVFLAVLGLSLVGCSYPMEELGLFKTGGLEVKGFSKFQNEKVSFDVVKATAMSTCLECHTSGSRSMDTAEEVLAQKDSILSVINKGTMPPRSSGYQPLSACEKQILETWIDDQMRSRSDVQKVGELSNCGEAEAPVQKPKTDLATLELSFENLKKEILAPKCMVCHSTETAKRTILETVADLHNHNLLAASAEESVLYQVTVPGMNKRFMPPQRGKTILAPLTEAELSYMKRWIEAGAK